jgi:hypothetical protein
MMKMMMAAAACALVAGLSAFWIYTRFTSPDRGVYAANVNGEIYQQGYDRIGRIEPNGNRWDI